MEEKISNTFAELDNFAQKVNTVRQRVNTLRHIGESSQGESGTTAEIWEELQNALEEMLVAEEELKAQNEQLLLTRAQVEAERQRYYNLFEFAPDSYLVTDEAGMIQQANRAAAKLLNISQHFLIGKPLINFILFEERRNFRSKLNQLRQMDWMQEWEITLSPRDSPVLNAAVTVSTFHDENKPVGWRWLLRDITARKQAEAQIRSIQVQNVQLQEVARLKSHFLAVMSHELRSPMNAIIGFSQLLLRYPHHELAPKQENMVQRILNSGRHLLTLIDDILDFSKIDAGGLKLKLEELNLAELVIATTEEIRSLSEQKNLALEVHLELQNPSVVNDSARLRQVLVNLLSNAIKFTDNGHVLLEVSELSSDRVVIAVKDTGIGIAEADRAHIFDTFRQANQTITRPHSGTGLGLAITDRLVQMMQGTITVESQLGQGSTFRINLPRHREVG